MTELGTINERWALQLTPDRVVFHAARPKWEAGRLEHMVEHVEPGMTVYDCGAECGDFTSLYRQWVGPTGVVVPIEPQPAYWPSIRQTWEANGYAPPLAWFPGFVGSRTTVDEFEKLLGRCGWPADLWPDWSLGKVQPDFGFKHLAQQADSVPTARIDDLAGLLGYPPDAIVFDIEGAEFEAIKGCAGLFDSVRPLLWVSVHDVGGGDWPGPLKAWYGATVDDIHAFMDGVGYRGELLPGYGEGESFWFYEPRP